jgi:hypothetical protein
VILILVGNDLSNNSVVSCRREGCDTSDGTFLGYDTARTTAGEPELFDCQVITYVDASLRLGKFLGSDQHACVGLGFGAGCQISAEP